ncbi:AAA family ATPase [candidate division KSB1 bacterium]|nr:AAA family ATPase [candidate division KSB1 bacterium]
MSRIIAITGKGGVGKTTLAALIITRLIDHGCKPVLAVDADPNACLDAALGVRVAKSLGTVREEAREIAGKGLAVGIAKQQLLELKIAESLVEATDFDLIAMGRPEGPGCYCYANNVLKNALAQIAAAYPFVVLDNEAGLENLSRRIVQSVDLLVMVADPSQRGLETVLRLTELAAEMGIVYRQCALVVNRLRRDGIPERVDGLAKSIGADYLMALPDDDDLAVLAENGAAVQNLSKNNPVVIKIDHFLAAAGY